MSHVSGPCWVIETSTESPAEIFKGTVCDGCGPKKDRVTADQDAMRLWQAVLYLILGPGTLASFCAYVLATASLGKLSETLLAFIDRYNQTAKPFNWKYTAGDLKDLLHRITEHEKQDTAQQSGLAVAA